MANRGHLWPIASDRYRHCGVVVPAPTMEAYKNKSARWEMCHARGTTRPFTVPWATIPYRNRLALRCSPPRSDGCHRHHGPVYSGCYSSFSGLCVGCQPLWVRARDQPQPRRGRCCVPSRDEPIGGAPQRGVAGYAGCCGNLVLKPSGAKFFIRCPLTRAAPSLGVQTRSVCARQSGRRQTGSGK